ncbi:MAG TPA: zinc ribbon domain-containing protein [Dehalococcoidia bacterium]
MPLYEYYCEHCDGIFEALRPMREASDPVPCPVCDRDGQRVMPTSFAAFTFRDGYPRSIPDKGTYYHLGKTVKSRISGPTRANEHPELKKPRPPKVKTKGELEDEKERKVAEEKYMQALLKDQPPEHHHNVKRLKRPIV